jgi:hypothetical protein
VRLEGQRATGHAALLRFALEQGEHGLMAAVHAVKVANRQRAGWRNVWVLETSENLHELL